MVPTTVEARMEEFLERVDGWRLDLTGLRQSDLLYQSARDGVRVYAATTRTLGSDRVTRIDEYRIAQYARIGFVNLDRMRHLLDAGAPLAVSGPDDVHVLATAEDGEVLCTAVLRALPVTSRSVRMGSRDRPLFPLEKVHGAGVFDRLDAVRDLPVTRVRELGGFVKTRRVQPMSELAFRAPLEVGVALFRTVAGPLAHQVDAVIGDLEESVAKLNLDFFGLRPVLVPGMVPVLRLASLLAPRYVQRDVCPFAILVDDAADAMPRLDAIERVLSESGDRSILRRLIRLRTNGASEFERACAGARA